MAKKKSEPQPEVRKLRGGSDSLHQRGLVQILIHCTPEERLLIHRASGLADQSTAQWGRALLVEAAERELARYKTAKNS